MKQIKLSHIALLAIFSLCLTAKAQPESTTYVVKKAPVKEVELKRWSHLDLEKDSVPGMSVDKVYAELLKNQQGKNCLLYTSRCV